MVPHSVLSTVKWPLNQSQHLTFSRLILYVRYLCNKVMRCDVTRLRPLSVNRETLLGVLLTTLYYSMMVTELQSLMQPESMLFECYFSH